MIVHKKRALLITTGLTFAIILALLFEIRALKPQIEAAASNAVGMDVRINGRMGIAFIPGFGISMKDVSVRNKGVDVVAIKKMTIGLELIPLVRREVLVSRVKLVKPVFSIVRYRNGRFNLDKPPGPPSKKPLAVAKSSVSHGKPFFY